MSGRPERMDRAESKWVLALLGLALALRVGFVLFQQPGFYFADSLEYDGAARDFLETGQFDRQYFRFPLYPVVMAASYRIFGTGLTPFRIFQAFLGTGTCLCVWLLGRRLFGSRAALLALSGAAVFPMHVVLAGIEYPVVPGTLLIWAVFVLVSGVMSGGSGSLVKLALGGMGVGLAGLLFEGGLALGLFLILWLLLSRKPRAFRLRSLAVTGMAALVVLAPWIYGMMRTGNYRALVLRAGIHLPTAPGVDPPLGEKNGGDLLMAKLSGIVRNPWWMVRYTGAEFVHFWDPYPDRLQAADPEFRKQLHREDGRMIVENRLVGDLPRLLYGGAFSVLLAAAAVGALVALRTAPGSGFLVAWPVVLGVCYAPFFTQMRYRIPADPAFILLGAYAVDLALKHSLWSGARESLKALWERWKRIAEKILVVQTFIILFILFALVMGPIALLMKLFRKDPMHAPTAPGSFWALRERTRERMEECRKQF